MYKTGDFFYNLPLELIAQEPIKKRDASRLLILDKETGDIGHKHFYNLIDFLEPNDVLILNNSKVFPARLFAKKDKTGGEIEVFLHQKKEDNLEKNLWECLLKGRVKIGTKLILSPRLEAVVLVNKKDGTYVLGFSLEGNNFWEEINKIGHVPLPPYIKREKYLEKSQALSDKKRYQTVFAEDNRLGSVAVPTAGLHFTKSILKKIQEKGVKVRFVTLHVGLGTFSPVYTEDIKEHKMHSEFVEISKETLKTIVQAKRKGSRVIAVGTTSCRSLESVAKIISTHLNERKDNQIEDIKTLSFWTDIFIFPGYKFKVIDALITNFHLPESTLLMLVSALASKEYIDNAYKKAIEEKYRFFSYGDAMFIR
jgi:S-adenosylmethionine:tRNA ribosyltransferase-isomerase